MARTTWDVEGVRWQIKAVQKTLEFTVGNVPELKSKVTQTIGRLSMIHAKLKAANDAQFEQMALEIEEVCKEVYGFIGIAAEKGWASEEVQNNPRGESAKSALTSPQELASRLEQLSESIPKLQQEILSLNEAKKEWLKKGEEKQALLEELEKKDFAWLVDRAANTPEGEEKTALERFIAFEKELRQKTQELYSSQIEIINLIKAGEQMGATQYQEVLQLLQEQKQILEGAAQGVTAQNAGTLRLLQAILKGEGIEEQLAKDAKEMLGSLGTTTDPGSIKRWFDRLKKDSINLQDLEKKMNDYVYALGYRVGLQTANLKKTAVAIRKRFSEKKVNSKNTGETSSKTALRFEEFILKDPNGIREASQKSVLIEEGVDVTGVVGIYVPTPWKISVALNGDIRSVKEGSGSRRMNFGEKFLTGLPVGDHKIALRLSSPDETAWYGIDQVLIRVVPRGSPLHEDSSKYYQHVFTKKPSSENEMVPIVPATEIDRPIPTSDLKKKAIFGKIEDRKKARVVALEALVKQWENGKDASLMITKLKERRNELFTDEIWPILQDINKVVNRQQTERGIGKNPQEVLSQLLDDLNNKGESQIPIMYLTKILRGFNRRHLSGSVAQKNN